MSAVSFCPTFFRISAELGQEVEKRLTVKGQRFHDRDGFLTLHGFEELSRLQESRRGGSAVG
jgi:hypothetical protein